MSALVSLFSGILMPAALLFCGGYFALRLGRFFIGSPKRVIFGIARATGQGGTSPWRTLSVALAGTLGVGNITGVALAVALGGAGAVFWMWVAALAAMFLKYAETLLALSTREAQGDRYHGGAMFYIRLAVRGRAGRVLAALFAVLCTLTSLTLGGVIQTSAAAEALSGALQIPPIAVGAVFGLAAALVLIRGLRGVERVSAALIPFLCAAYTVLSLVAIIRGRAMLPAAFSAIFRGAFSVKSGLAGVGGFLASGAFRYGISRGLISNEAGCGTSPIAHAASGVSDPAAEGLFGVLEVFVDTILLCTLTALVLLTSGVAPSVDGTFVLRAFGASCGEFARPILAVFMALFAFATVLCWAHYGQESLSYLTDHKKILTAHLVAVSLSAFLGAVAAPALLWDMTDLVLAFLTLLNLPALFLCRKTVLDQTKRFFGAKKRPDESSSGREPWRGTDRALRP